MQIYIGSKLFKTLGWKQFHKITKKHCRWAIKPQRKSDYCDHCALFERSIRPGISKVVKKAREEIIQIHPEYFDAFDSRAPQLSKEPVAHIAAFLTFCDTHASARAGDRKALSRTKRLNLHEVEALVCHVLRHEVKVAKSYDWHRNSADRQSHACQTQKQNLSEQELLLWFDYKQKFSLPVANVATGEMFYGTDRMEMSVFGVAVLQNVKGKIVQQNIIYISSIIENTGLMTCMLLDDVKAKIPGFSEKKVTLWSDVGPHFRSYDVLAHLSKAWYPSMNGNMRICYFCEKHGKGEIDGMFAHMGKCLGRMK